MAGRGAFKNEFGENSEHQRPRRPSEETLKYIQSLPLDLKAASDEIELFLLQASKGNESSRDGNKDDEDDEDDNYPQLFAAALASIDEIRTEIASLAGDDDGSQCLEILTRITAPYSELAIRKLLMGCSGYFLHLSTHRYGSHVVQTILQLSTSFLYPSDLAQKILDDDQFRAEDKALPSLSDLIAGVAEELTPHASQLAIHVCGSHVLRTLLCVLAGIDLIASPGSTGTLAENGNIRRGRVKAKKKKKKPAAAENNNSQSHAGLMHMVYKKPSDLRVSIENDSFHAAVDALTEELSGSSTQRPGELQKLASHPSAGPLLIVLLRVLTYVSCPEKEKWQEASEKLHHSATNQRHLGIQPPHPQFRLDSTAHILAKKILCWPEDEQEEETFVSDVIYGLAGEPRGSHMLETLLCVSPGPFYESLLTYGDFYNRSTLQEYIDDPVSNFVVQTLLTSVQTKEQAETILKAMSPIISSGLVIDAEKRRRGTLWRSVELAANHRVGQDGLLKAIRLGFASLQENVSTLEEDTETLKETKQKKKQRKKASSIELSACIPLLLSAKEGDEGRVTLDASGARTVFWMLRFAPRLCEDTIKGILSYSVDMLTMFARDGLASRCIWDGLLDGPTESPSFSQGLKKLREMLSGQWVTLSCDRVGQHVVKKMFRVSPEQERLKITEELSKSVPRLSGNAMGRNVLEVCAVREFSQGIETWKRAVKKVNMQDEWLNEVLGVDDMIGGHNKRSRSRKRKASEDSNAGTNKSIGVPNAAS